jgi:hypothetical protein
LKDEKILLKIENMLSTTQLWILTNANFYLKNLNDLCPKKFKNKVMKKKFIQNLMILALGLPSFIFAQDLTYEGKSLWINQWDPNVGESQDGNVIDVEKDAAGNTYLLMKIVSLTDLDPGAGEVMFQSNVTNYATHVLVKLNANQEYQWHRSWDLETSLEGQVLFADMAILSNGNIFLVGTFSGTMDADPTTGEDLFTGFGGTDYCSVVIDPSGAYVSKSSNGASGNDYGLQVEVDAQGNVYLAIQYQASTVAEMLRIVKLSPSLATLWVADFTNNPNDNGSIMGALAVAPNGDVFVAGRFYGYYDFNPGAGTQFEVSDGAPNSNLFLVKLNSSGVYQWVKNIGVDGPQRYFNDVHVDASNNVYFSFSYYPNGSNPMEIAPSVSVSTNGATVVKYDNAGAYQWHNTFEEIAHNSPWSASIAVLKIAGTTSDNKIYFSGSFNNNLVLNATVNSNSNPFLAVADLADGTIDNVLFYETSNGDIGIAPLESLQTKVLNDGTVLSFGKQLLIRDLDLTSGEDLGQYDTNSNDFPLFFAEHSQDLEPVEPPVNIDELSQSALVVYPNPTSNLVNIQNILVGAAITVTDLSGRVVYTTIANNSMITLSTEYWSNGMYLIQTELNGAVQQQKLVVSK